MNKIALGTVQFGIDYGVNNKRGKIRPEEGFRILDEAVKVGIDTIDTAYSYGDSENVIGDFIKSGKRVLKIISKTPVGSSREAGRVFKESLNRLGVSALYGYLVHNFENYKKDERLWDELERFKSEGRVEKIGFSLYSPSELESLFKKGLPVDIIQFPFSIFDQRFGPYLSEMKKRKIEVHARSVFLQGLVFKNPEGLDKYFAKIRDKIEALNYLSGRSDVSIVSLCVNFVTANEYIDKVVVGVDGLENFIEIISASRSGPLPKDTSRDLLNFRIDDEDILLPSKWKLSETAA
jgi:aryl-alcohol dehydrogenase-like predicted oxidoreductase